MRFPSLSSAFPHLVNYRFNIFRSRAMSTRSYKDAVEHLNSLQSNAATLEALRASGGRSSDLAHPEMIEYLGRIGYTVRVRYFSQSLVYFMYRVQPEDLNKLNVLHVTGTKGKGSTSAFVDSILRHVKPQWTTGTKSCLRRLKPNTDDFRDVRSLYLTALSSCARTDTNKRGAHIRGRLHSVLLRGLGQTGA